MRPIPPATTGAPTTRRSTGSRRVAGSSADVSGPVPRWATNGASDKVTRPARRSSRSSSTPSPPLRPEGRHVVIWNEPNQPQFLCRSTRRANTPLSPRIYRKLFLAAKRGWFAAATAEREVLIAETSPRGTGKVVAPLTFLRGMLCLDANYHKQGPAPSCTPPATPTTRTRRRRPAVQAQAAQRRDDRRHRAPRHRARPGGEGRGDPAKLPITSPSSGSSRRRTGSRASASPSRPTTARSPSASPTRTRASSAFSQYLLRDDPPNPNATSPIDKYSGFESGLRTNTGKRSPRSTSFPLPLAASGRARRSRCGASCGVATGATTVTVEYSSGGSFKKLFTTTTDARGYFTKSATFLNGRGSA